VPSFPSGQVLMVFSSEPLQSLCLLHVPNPLAIRPSTCELPRGCAPVESPSPAKFSTKTRTLQRGGRAGRIEHVAAASSARNRPWGTCGSAVRRDHSRGGGVSSRMAATRRFRRLYCVAWVQGRHRVDLDGGRRRIVSWEIVFFFWLHVVTVVGGKARKFWTGGGGEQTTVNRVIYMDGRIRFNFLTQVYAFIISRDRDMQHRCLF
jgi:hypothetical protein